jgi:hypothetical protein
MRVSAIALPLCLAAVWLTGCSSEPAESAPRQYSMGEKIPVGGLTFTVFETQWATHFRDGVEARIPQNRFFLIRLNVVNGGIGEAAIPTFTVQDDNGHTYEELSDGDGVPQWMGYLHNVKPADFAQGNILFDAPPGHYKLKVSDGQKHVALVDIPLSFGAETPDLLSPLNEQFKTVDPASPAQK